MRCHRLVLEQKDHQLFLCLSCIFIPNIGISVLIVLGLIIREFYIRSVTWRHQIEYYSLVSISCQASRSFTTYE